MFNDGFAASCTPSNEKACALRDVVVSFSDDPTVIYDVPCCAEIYGCHPSRLLATSRGWIQSNPDVDRFSGKSATEMNNRRKIIKIIDGTNKVNSHTPRDMILRQLETDNKLWLHECTSAPCVKAFVATHCHFSQCRSSDQNSDDHNILVHDWCVIDNRQTLQEEIHARQIQHEGAADTSETAQDVEVLVSDKSQIGCMVLHTVQDNKSTMSSSSKGSTFKSSANSRTGSIGL